MGDDEQLMQLVEDLRRIWIRVPPVTPPPMVYPVADLVREEMAERGWDVRRASVEMEMPTDVLDEILEGARITRYAAKCIANGFGTSVQFWVRLDWRTRPR